MVQFLNGLKTGQFEIQTFKKSGFQIPTALKLEYPPLLLGIRSFNRLKMKKI